MYVSQESLPTLFFAALGFLIAVYTIYVLYRWIVSQRTKAQAEISTRQTRSRDEATNRATSARRKLEKQAGRPIVLELINNMIFDGSAGGAKEEIDVDAAIEVLAQLKSATETQPVEIVLHTLGGWSIAAEVIANAIKNRKGSTKAYVPYLAMSAGTMIALACKEIHLGKNASLGPIDTQVDRFPASSYRRLKTDKPPANMREDYLLLSYEAEKIEQQELEKACELLNDEHKKLDGNDVCKVARELAGKGRKHSELIGFKAAKTMGINVKEGCPEAVYDLVDNRIEEIRKHSV